MKHKMMFLNSLNKRNSMNVSCLMGSGTTHEELVTEPRLRHVEALLLFQCLSNKKHRDLFGDLLTEASPSQLDFELFIRRKKFSTKIDKRKRLGM